MEIKNISVYGLFDSRYDLEKAVDSLRATGFRAADISVLLADFESTKQFAHEKGTKAPEGASAGAGTGAAIGGTLGWLAGIGAIVVPGLGPFIAAGPVMGLLAGIGAGGAVGGLAGALVGAGIPEYEAKRYEGRVTEGGILMSVHCDSDAWQDKAHAILRRSGARDIASSSEGEAELYGGEKPRKIGNV